MASLEAVGPVSPSHQIVNNYPAKECLLLTFDFSLGARLFANLAY